MNVFSIDFSLPNSTVILLSVGSLEDSASESFDRMQDGFKGAENGPLSED
jgi:hypothetical protein